MIEPTTAIRAPGTTFSTYFVPRMMAATTIETASVQPARVTDVLERAPQLLQRPPCALRNAEHAADLARSDLDADAGEEADEHGAREEVGEEAEMDEPSEDQIQRCQKSGKAGEGDVLRRSGRRHPGEPGSQDRRGGGVGADDEVARRAEHGEHGDRQQDRVEAGDHRHAGDLRVPHRLRNRERGEGDAGEHIDRRRARGRTARSPAEAGRANAGEEAGNSRPGESTRPGPARASPATLQAWP